MMMMMMSSLMSPPPHQRRSLFSSVAALSLIAVSILPSLFQSVESVVVAAGPSTRHGRTSAIEQLDATNNANGQSSFSPLHWISSNDGDEQQIERRLKEEDIFFVRENHPGSQHQDQHSQHQPWQDRQMQDQASSLLIHNDDRSNSFLRKAQARQQQEQQQREQRDQQQLNNGPAQFNCKLQYYNDKDQKQVVDPDQMEMVLDWNNPSTTTAETQLENNNADAANYFSADYLYSFQPLDSNGNANIDIENIENVQLLQWRVHRIPKSFHLNNANIKQSTSSRQLQETFANGATSTTPLNNDDNDANDATNPISLIITNSLLSLLCVITAALAAGLTMGMLSLDPLSLEIKRRASVISSERQRSAQLLPLLVGHQKRHRLLVSLLILNSLANEALPLFLDELLPGKYASIFVSVTLVLFFGEIVPSAFFTGPNQVEVAAKLVPVVKVVMVVLAPIAVPIARLLDKVLHDGDEEDHSGGAGADAGATTIGGTTVEEVQDVTGGTYYDRSELTALVRIQHEAQVAKKRRSKLMNQKMLLPENNATLRGKRVTIASPSHPLETVSSHSSNHSGGSSSRNNCSFRRTHHDIKSIGRELTSTSTSTNANANANASAAFSTSKGPIQRFSHYHPTTPETAQAPITRMPSIHADEITMIEGALAMTTKVAADVATPLRRVYALPTDTILDEETVVEIWARGFSRVPVFLTKPDLKSQTPSSSSSTEQSALQAPPLRRNTMYEDMLDVSSIVGVLLVRQLIVVNPNENRPLATIPLSLPPCVAPSMHLVDLINLFQAGGGRGKGGLHLALVCARPHIATEALEKGECVPKEAGVIGIVTLEDVVEELLQEEIYDEYDRDLELAQWGVDKWRLFVKKKKKKKKELGADGVAVRRVVIAAEAVASTETTPLIGRS